MDKGNRSPYEAFASNPKGYNWDDICARVNQLHESAKGKRKRFAPDAMETFEKESAFIARQLSDNAYLSKVARKYLRAVCEHVWTVSGGMTKLLRDKWDIDSLLKRKIDKEQIMLFNLKDSEIGMYKKNRYDHRHHALDAMVIGLIDPAIVNKIATMNARHLKHRIVVPEFPFNRGAIIEKLRNTAVSHKPDHGIEGRLSLETALAKIKIDGKEFFANRIPITSLNETNIERIVDPVIKRELLDFLAKHRHEKFEDCIVQFGKERIEKKQINIKRVRCKTFAQKPICIPPKKNNPLSVARYYNPEDYFCAVIWELPLRKKGKNQDMRHSIYAGPKQEK